MVTAGGSTLSDVARVAKVFEKSFRAVHGVVQLSLRRPRYLDTALPPHSLERAAAWVS